MKTTYTSTQISPTLQNPILELGKLEDDYFNKVRDLSKNPTKWSKLDTLSKNLFTLTTDFFDEFDMSDEVQNVSKKLFEELFKNPLSPSSTKALKETLFRSVEKVTKGPFTQIEKQGLKKIQEKLYSTVEAEKKTFISNLPKNYDCKKCTEIFNEKIKEIAKKFDRDAVRFKRFVDKIPDKLGTFAKKTIDLRLKLLEKNSGPKNSDLSKKDELEFLLYSIKRPLGFLFLEKAIEKRVNYQRPRVVKKDQPNLSARLKNTSVSHNSEQESSFSISSSIFSFSRYLYRLVQRYSF